jgi:hypothetical protein
MPSFWWTLSIREQRSNVLIIATIIFIVVDWWVLETRISLDKWKVTWKSITPFQHDEKLNHYLMEIKVSFNI